MTGQVWFALVLAAVIVAVMPGLLLRDLRRARMRQEIRRLTRPMARAFDALKVQIGLALLPAMQQAARAMVDMQESMQRVAETINADHSEAMQRLKDASQPPKLHPETLASLGAAFRAIAPQRKDDA